ncbi:hypothetical protein quinque_014333 [Culex quinquefasciatus]
MSWDRLPLEIYVSIFKNLDFWDRKPLSLVCRQWNAAVYSRSLCRNLCIELSRGDWVREATGRTYEEVKLVDEGVVQETERDYRVVYVKWCKESDPEVLGSIDRLLRELDEKCLLEGMIVDAPLGQSLIEFFGTHADLLGRIRKLQMCTEATENTSNQQLVVRMDKLEALTWRDIVMNNQVQIRKPVFLVDAPNLKSAVLKFGDCDSDVGIVWHNGLMELERGGSLKILKMHLNGSMWQDFFLNRLETLEHLSIILQKTSMTARDWDSMFANLPNLKNLQLVNVNDFILEAIHQHCQQLKVLRLEKVDLTVGFLSVDRMFPKLEHLQLESGNIRSNRNLVVPALKRLEWSGVKNLDNLSLTVIAPNLRSLKQSKYGHSDFIVSCCPLLEELQLDLFASDIPEHFFQSLPRLRQLSIRISSACPALERVLPNFRNIEEFTLITYNAPLQCDILLASMFKHCERVTSLTMCGFNPNLELSFPVFAQIFRNRLLKSLKLFGLTIKGNSSPVQLPPDLAKFELRYVRVMDVAFGAYVFPPDGPFQVVCNKSDDCCCYFSKDCD